MRKEKKEMNLNETIFGTSYMIGVDRSNGKVENINLIDLMDELNFIPDGAVPGDLNVVWYEDKFNDYMKEIHHFVNGKIFHGEGKRTGDVYNPAHGEKIAKVAFANSKDISKNDCIIILILPYFLLPCLETIRSATSFCNITTILVKPVFSINLNNICVDILYGRFPITI